MRAFTALMHAPSGGGFTHLVRVRTSTSVRGPLASDGWSGSFAPTSYRGCGRPFLISAPCGRLKAGSAGERGHEIGEAGQLIESVHEFLPARDGAGTQHHARQLAKLRSDLVFSIGMLEVAAGAFPQARDLSAVGERDRHPGRLEPRHTDVERRIFADRDSPADRRD